MVYLFDDLTSGEMAVRAAGERVETIRGVRYAHHGVHHTAVVHRCNLRPAAVRSGVFALDLAVVDLRGPGN